MFHKQNEFALLIAVHDVLAAYTDLNRFDTFILCKRIEEVYFVLVDENFTLDNLVKWNFEVLVARLVGSESRESSDVFFELENSFAREGLMVDQRGSEELLSLLVTEKQIAVFLLEDEHCDWQVYQDFRLILLVLFQSFDAE